MKKLFLSVYMATLMMLLFSSCKKDDDTTPPASANYSPLTTGSNWTYQYVESNDTSSYELTVTGADTSINGRNYKVLAGTDGENSYLAKSGNDYYRFASFPNIGIGGFEELYLKDNAAVNAQWKDTVNFTVQSFPISAFLTYTLKEKGGTRSVSGKTYNNVIFVRLDISALGLNTGGGDFYYADGVGLIESNILVTPPPLFGGSPYAATQKLTDHEIK